MNKELIDKIITYNYNEFGNEFGDCIVDMKKEIERLNNNINKLEKELEDMATLKTDKYGNTRKITHIDINWLLTKIKELKGVDKE